jgi:hypothetical protein
MVKGCDLGDDTKRLSVDPIVKLANSRKNRAFFRSDERCVIFEPLDKSGNLCLHFAHCSAGLAYFQLDQMWQITDQKLCNLVERVRANVARGL